MILSVAPLTAGIIAQHVVERNGVAILYTHERLQPSFVREERAACPGATVIVRYRELSDGRTQITKLTFNGRQISKGNLQWLNQQKAIKKAEFVRFRNCNNLHDDGWTGMQLIAEREGASGAHTIVEDYFVSETGVTEDSPKIKRKNR